jgi:hypothetical protein
MTIPQYIREAGIRSCRVIEPAFVSPESRQGHSPFMMLRFIGDGQERAV